MTAATTHPTHRSDDFSRGLGVLLFRNRSMGAALTFFVLMALALWLFLSLAGVIVIHNRHEIGVAISVVWASFLLEVVGRDFGEWPVWTTGGWEKWPPSAIVAEPYFGTVAGAVWHTLLWSLALATVVTIPLAIVAHRAVKSFGRRMLTGKHLRGAVQLADAELAREVRRRRQATPLQIGQIPLPVATECEHLAFIGSPGTGKTQAILRLLDAIRARGDAAVIYDSKGTFTSHHYQARHDVLLNPLDARTLPWSPWAEIEDAMDADRVAKALIPDGGHKEPFFHETARILLSAALSKLEDDGDGKLGRLLHLMLHASIEERTAFFAGTEAAQTYDQGGDRMRSSVEQNLRTYARSLRYLPLASGGKGDFSILRHIQGIDERERQPWLFLPSPLRIKHHSIKPLITCWLDCAVAALTSCGERRDRRCWFIIDEVKSLYNLPSLPDLMAEGRSFGACVVLGFQDLAQLRRVYGPDDAKTMSAVLGTKVLFKIADPETAKWGADALGEFEEEIVKESTRYDAAGDTPKGVQLAAQRVQRHLVMPAELQRQPRFHCWVQLSGDWPVAQTRLPEPKAHERKVIANAIVHADPKTTYAARIADIPDPPKDAEPDEDEPPDPALTASPANEKTRARRPTGPSRNPRRPTTQAERQRHRQAQWPRPIK